MKNPCRKLMTLGAVLPLLFVGACGQGGGGGVDDDTPEGAAFLYRQAVMRVLARKMGPIGGMARGDIPVDEAAFAKSVNDLVVMAGMVTEGFGPDVSNSPGASAALPEVWSNAADFNLKAADLQSAAQGLAAAVASGGFASAQALVQSTAGNCGGCHRNYRRRDE